MDLSVEPSYMSDTEADEEPSAVAAATDTKLFDKNVVSSANRRFSAEPAAEPVVLDPNSNSSSSSLKAVRYRECMRNHAASIGGHANDGCGEFMARGPDGTRDSLSCAACGCHRNFHRREVSYTAAGIEGGSAVLSAPTLLLHHQPHHHGRAAGGGVYHHQLSAAPLKSAPPHLQRQLTMLSQNTAPKLNSKWAAKHDEGNNEEEDEDDVDHEDGGGVRRDDNMEVDYDRTPEREESALRMGPIGPAAQFGSSGGGPTMAAPVNAMAGGTMMRIGKRFRTKFTSEQKERMLGFAERLGWRLQRHDDVSLNNFCAEIGVTRNVFKVWMHNNKNLHRPRSMGMGTTTTTTTTTGEFLSSSPAAPPQQMVDPPPHPSSHAPPQSVGV